MFAGGLSGSFLEHNVGSSLDKMAINIDWLAGLAKLTLVTITSSLIGKTHAATTHEDVMHANHYNATEPYEQGNLVEPVTVEESSII